MEIALKEAEQARERKEAPIGAIIVKNGEVIAKGYNLRESGRNSLYHAEIIAIDRACKYLEAWRLVECDMYVTLEPCLMCAGAILQSRIRRLVFGAYDPKGGACGSVSNVLAESIFNHHVEVAGGVMQDRCGRMLSDFFRELRSK